MSNFRNEVNRSQIQRMHDKILEELSEYGAYTYHKALTGSIYIKFKHKKLYSLRIADHKGRTKYSYKWNLTLNGKTAERKDQQHGNTRFYYNFKDLERFLDHFKKYANVALNDTRGAR